MALRLAVPDVLVSKEVVTRAACSMGTISDRGCHGMSRSPGFDAIFREAGRCVVRHLLQVSAGAECLLPGSGEDADMLFWVGFEFPHGFRELPLCQAVVRHPPLSNH